MDEAWAVVIAAGIAGIVTLVAAILARAEPRGLKELRALNEIIDRLPADSDSRASLVSRRERIARRYGREPVSAVTVVVRTLVAVGAAAIIAALTLAVVGSGQVSPVSPEDTPTLVFGLGFFLFMTAGFIVILVAIGQGIDWAINAAGAWIKRRRSRVRLRGEGSTSDEQ